jgi:hypothetical protein
MRRAISRLLLTTLVFLGVVTASKADGWPPDCYCCNEGRGTAECESEAIDECDQVAAGNCHAFDMCMAAEGYVYTTCVS